MKVLGVIGVIVSVISLSLGLHLHFVYAKLVHMVNSQIDDAIADRGLNFLQSQDYRDWFQIVDFQTNYGMLVLLLGTISIIISIFPAVKKFKFAWAGVIFGLITFFIGTLYGTHLFD